MKKMKRISLLALLLIFVTSLAVVGCGGGGGAQFRVSSCTASPNPIEAGSTTTISATVLNYGGASGTYNATLTIGGANIGTQSVAVAAGATQTVTFNYTPTTAGTLNVSVGTASCSLGVTQATTGYWDITYHAVNGSYIMLNYSTAGITPVKKIIPFNESSGISFVIRVNKSVVNGARDVIIPASGWVFPKFRVPEIMTGVDMDLTMPVVRDAVGTLYVQNGKGDVDMTSVSNSSLTPIQKDTRGDGIMDPAGSLWIPITLNGIFHTTVGQDGNLPFGLTFTTGNSSNVVNIKINPKMNGASVKDNGVPFAESGGVADYVGTAGTILTTGTGDCLGIKLVGIRIDFQTEIKLVLEPVTQ